jgi:tetratricopeptide (TPR) repeat protein
LRRFLQYFPQSTQIAEAYYLLGISYFNLESFLSALDNFMKIEQEHRETDFYQSSVQNIAFCYNRLGEKEKALKYLQQYIVDNNQADDRFQIYLQMAQLQYENGQIDKAIEVFNKLSHNKDKNIAAEASCNLGEIYVSQNNMEAAIRAFQVAIDKGERDNYYRLNSIAQLAAIYENAGDSKKAINSYELLTQSTTDEQWITAAQERINALK